jgi:hypothetical protein
MRQKKRRLIGGGLVFMAFAGAVFWVVAGQMARSTDASGMMQEVGQVSGLVGAIGVARDGAG